MGLFIGMKHRKRMVIELSLAVFAIAVLLWVMVPKYLASQNINTPECFPDPHFRHVVADALHKQPLEAFSAGDAAEFDGTIRFLVRGGVASELERRDAGGFIKSIEGIEYLPNLKTLELYDDELEQIDLSKNAKLEHIRLVCDVKKELKIQLHPDVQHTVEIERLGVLEYYNKYRY